MRRDGPERPERPELPSGRRQPEDQERGFLWPPTPGELALCVLLFILFFILFFAFSWGLVLWDGVFINTSDTAADNGLRRPHRRGPDGGLLRGAGGGGGLYRERNRHHGQILRQAPAPALRQRSRTTGKIPGNPHVLPRRREQPLGRSTRRARLPQGHMANRGDMPVTSWNQCS